MPFSRTLERKLGVSALRSVHRLGSEDREGGEGVAGLANKEDNFRKEAQKIDLGFVHLLLEDRGREI